MTTLVAWGLPPLAASGALMALVLVMRSPVRHMVGPRLAYGLWALPVLRMIVPSLPFAHAPTLPPLSAVPGRMLVLAFGTTDEPRLLDQPALMAVSAVVLLIWAAGVVTVFGVHAVRHLRYCANIRATGITRSDNAIRVVEADVDGPVAFGVFQRFVAVPRAFAQRYDAREQKLALAHEYAHHARGDLIANWVALLVLAIHWWNPIAWVASAAFHDDQEFAADAHVLGRAEPSALLPYASLLAKAAGIGAPPVCNLHARSNLRGRLMMLNHQKRPVRQVAFGGMLAALIGGAALAATAVQPLQAGSPAGRQAVTIGVKPDGSGAYSLLVNGMSVAPGASLPKGQHLPADFSDAGGCDLSPHAKPTAMAIKGQTPVETYTVICARATPASVRATLGEGLASLKTMRRSVATQRATSSFPDTERAHALAAIDRSINEVRETLTKLG